MNIYNKQNVYTKIVIVLIFVKQNSYGLCLIIIVFKNLLYMVFSHTINMEVASRKRPVGGPKTNVHVSIRVNKSETQLCLKNKTERK